MNHIGLNLSDASIEVAELQQGWFGRPKLIAVGRSVLPAGCIEQGVIKQLDVVIEKIKLACAEAKSDNVPHAITAKLATMAVPEAQIYSRLLRFPKDVSQEQLRHTIQVQFSDYLPFEITEVAYDYLRLGQTNDQIDVLLAAVPITILKSYTALCQQLGYHIQALELESISSARAVLSETSKAATSTLLLDLGAHTTIASWFDRYGLCFTFNQALAGEALTDSIVASLKVPVTEAEQLKQRLGLTGKTASSIQTTLQPLLTQIREGMNYVQQSAGLQTDRIMLIGGTAQLPGLADWLQGQLGVTVELAKLLPGLQTNGIIDGIYYNAIGLALGGSKHYQARPKINFYRA